MIFIRIQTISQIPFQPLLTIIFGLISAYLKYYKKFTSVLKCPKPAKNLHLFFYVFLYQAQCIIISRHPWHDYSVAHYQKSWARGQFQQIKAHPFRQSTNHMPGKRMLSTAQYDKPITLSVQKSKCMEGVGHQWVEWNLCDTNFKFSS